MSWVQANGLRFHVQRLDPPADLPGPRPVVVFLHGLVIDNLSSFYYTLAAPVVRSGATAVLYDQRGHGLTDRPPAGYRLDDAVDDLVAVLDGLGLTEPVYLIGNSYGGLVAARAAARVPHRVAGLALIEAHCIGVGGEEWLEGIANTLTVSAAGLHHDQVARRLAGLGQRKTARMADTADKLLNGTTLIDDLATGSPLTPDELAAFHGPVLGVFGERSELISGAGALAGHVRDCTTVVMPGLAHTVLREATPALRRLVVAWLDERKLDGRTPAPAVAG